MALALLKIVSTTVLTTVATAYGTAVAVGFQQMIRRAVLANYSTNVPTITVNVASTTGSTLSNQLITRALQVGESYIAPELAGIVLRPGEQIYASCSLSSSVSLTVSGIQVST